MQYHGGLLLIAFSCCVDLYLGLANTSTMAMVNIMANHNHWQLKPGHKNPGIKSISNLKIKIKIKLIAKKASKNSHQIR